MFPVADALSSFSQLLKEPLISSAIKLSRQQAGYRALGLGCYKGLEASQIKAVGLCVEARSPSLLPSCLTSFPVPLSLYCTLGSGSGSILLGGEERRDRMLRRVERLLGTSCHAAEHRD